MRFFRIGDKDEFTEYGLMPFDAEHDEKILECWLQKNPDGMVEDEKILLIGHQVRKDLGGFVDLLGVDREGNPVIIELKRDRTPREVIAQALAYAAWAERCDLNELEGIFRKELEDDAPSLAEAHREAFELDEHEGVAFNKDQRIVIVGQRVTPEIRRTAEFLGSKGIRVTCVEFTFSEADDEGRLFSHEIVVGKAHQKEVRPPPVLSEEQFFTSCETAEREFFGKLLEWARKQTMPVHWGSKRFSLHADIGGTHVHLSYASPDGTIVDLSQDAVEEIRDPGPANWTP